MTEEKQIEDITQYYVLRNKDTGMYFRGKGVNRWGKYFNQATIYRVKGTAEASVREVSWHGEKAEVVPIQIFENEAGYRKADEVAREIFEEIEKMLNLQAKIVCKQRADYEETDNPMLSFMAMMDGRIYSLRVVEEHIAELKKKYTEDGE